jgi:hypothetical protein
VAIGTAVVARRPRQPAAAVAALALAVLIGRDLSRFPEQLASLAAPVMRVNPGGVRALPAIAGIVAGLGMFGALWQPWRRRRVAEGIVAAAALAFAAVLVHAWMPAVSRQRSAKHLYERWRQLDPGGPPPAMWRTSPAAAALHAAGGRTARSRDELAGWLARGDVRFAVVAGSEMCSLRAALIERGGGALRVHAGDPGSSLLVSGPASPLGAPERSPLAGVLEHRPHDRRPAIANLDGELELVAVDLPRRAARGGWFELTLTFRVVRTPTRPWQVFVHIERGEHRFQGDHPPISKLCPTALWQPGDIAIDRHRLRAGNIAHPRGRYDVRVGLFVGGGGSWTNMPVRAGDRDEHDRIRVGTIDVD